ncbi:acetyltransferase [Methyloglobulus sp.]|uniref:acetyltransferase n=1 Tax=Methyloglobulus sp. TaxID=2518622 RepID=UPI0032B73C54
MIRRLAILGASGHGKVVAEIAELCGWDEIHFFDDNWPDVITNGPWNVLGDTNSLAKNSDAYNSAIVAIGNNSIRYDKSLYLIAQGFNLATLIHPLAIVSGYSEISAGSVVMAGAVINPFAKIGMATIINTSATVDHDCMIEYGVHVSPGVNIAGAVFVGALTWLGIGANIKQCVSIGRQVVVGAGSVVVNDISDGLTVVGVPAKAF